MNGKPALAAVAATAVALGAAGLAGAKTYYGVVGPGQAITFENGKGQAVSRIKTGTHTIKIHDKSSLHNFHLIGPGVNKKTKVAFTGRKTWKLTFSAGRYVFRCDPHRTHMRGSFRARS